jgi:hypothetical protein
MRIAPGTSVAGGGARRLTQPASPRSSASITRTRQAEPFSRPGRHPGPAGRAEGGAGRRADRVRLGKDQCWTLAGIAEVAKSGWARPASVRWVL